MLKTRVGKVTTLAVVLLVAVGAMIVGSRTHFPFRHPRASLNRYLKQDFGVEFPASAVVEESYWVGYRTSEAVFKIQMAPEELLPFVVNLGSIARTKEHWRTSALDLRVSHPIYDPPPWWNVPPLPDAQSLDIIVSDGGEARCHFLLLYSPSTGKLYLVWGGR